MTRNMKKNMALIATLVMAWTTTLAHADGEEPCQPQWVQTFGPAPGVNEDLHTFRILPNLKTGTPALYACGYFTTAGGKLASRIAMWDGEEWHSIGDGFNNRINDMMFFDDGSGNGSQLHVAGSFTAAGGATAEYVAKWDGKAWSNFGNGLGQFARAIAAYDDGSGNGKQIYVGGSFSLTLQGKRISRWNGTSWTPLGDGLNDFVESLLVVDEGRGEGPVLLVSGGFTTADGIPASRIAKWNGSWSAHSSAVFDGAVYGLKMLDDGLGEGPKLHAFGSFTTIDGAPAVGMAKWNGDSWEAIAPSGPDGLVQGLDVFDDGKGPAYYVGGNFETVDGVAVNNIAKWNGNRWSSLAGGTQGYAPTTENRVYDVITFDDGTGGGPRLYAGGGFRYAGGVPAHCVAQWDGSTWSALHESGFNWKVNATAWHDDDQGGGPALYAAGLFTFWNGLPVQRIAKWEGSQWSTVGEGIEPSIQSFATFDDQAGEGRCLFAGGYVTPTGESLLKWNGRNWTAIDAVLTNVLSGSTPVIWTMVEFDDGSGPALFVAGQFTHINGIEVNGIARWNGRDWSSLGSGITFTSNTPASIRSLFVFDDGNGEALYAGGVMNTAGGVSARGVAKWNGTAWSTIGNRTSGFNGVRCMAVFDDASGSGPALFAGGSFTTVNDITTNHVAKFHQGTWVPVGGGVDHAPNIGNVSVESMATFDDGVNGPSLYIGGQFGYAGGMRVYNMAKWDGLAWSDAGEAEFHVDHMLIIPEGTHQSLIISGGFGGSSAGDGYIARLRGCARVCLGDVVNGDTFAPPPDGEVDGADLAYLLVQWGRNPGSYADIVSNATFLPPPDGVVDGADLAVVLDAWGECE